ncbi:hypothetical protein HMPREF0791_1918, partial [Staphylococcus epidermidis W23144]
QDHVTVPVTTNPEKDVIAPDAPTINQPSVGDKTISGKGEPGSTITVTFPDGSTTTGKVDGNGDWTVTVPDEITLHEGDKITAISTDDSGNKSNPTDTTVVDHD